MGEETVKLQDRMLEAMGLKIVHFTDFGAVFVDNKTDKALGYAFPLTSDEGVLKVLRWMGEQGWYWSIRNERGFTVCFWRTEWNSPWIKIPCARNPVWSEAVLRAALEALEVGQCSSPPMNTPT
jgi:hypothetical protein